MLKKHVIGPGGKRTLAFEPENDAERREMKANNIPIASDLLASREQEVNPPERPTRAPAKPTEPAADDSN